MQIREYELGSKVHQDGIGILYNADNTETAERAYLKVLDKAHANDPELVTSFQQCAELCCSLENKYQLQTLAHGEENGWHYIIFEYANFQPMERVLTDHNFVSVAETVRFVERLAIKRTAKSGSVGLKIGQIAERKADLYVLFSDRSCAWDACAPEAVLRAAGGQLTDLAAQPLHYGGTDVRNRRGLLACNAAAFDAVRPVVAALGSEHGLV